MTEPECVKGMSKEIRDSILCILHERKLLGTSSTKGDADELSQKKRRLTSVILEHDEHLNKLKTCLEPGCITTVLNSLNHPFRMVYPSLSNHQSTSIQLLDDSTTKTELVNHFETSVTTQLSKKPGREGEFGHSPRFKVLNVYKVNNPMMENRYANYVLSLSSLKNQSWNIDHKLKFARRCGDGEYLLYHGGKFDNMEVIARNGFSRLFNKRGMFGGANYLASQSSKSDCYCVSDCGSSCGRGKFRMLVVQVCTGHSEPLFKANHAKTCPSAGYHSAYAVTRDEGGGVHHPEVMMYIDDGLVVKYIIEYEHMDYCNCTQCELCT